ncbi:MAG: undecaprenyldiphospho-muramoylpentapeptide beta-N-acetylglucosaminyltransferase [Oxalobacteraceae bacterium]|nr:undecaprenyldiphospho-muramoylpentapeptide beta-N-acetylglucosaminyltransferase [Oxalobacteraceae bacterium]
MKHLMVMAAGTGGHIFPGLAIADTMRARGWQVSWLGTQRGMEAEIVPRHGLAFDAIDFSGLRGKGLMHTVTGVFKLAAGFLRCRAILRSRAPDVVLGMGGYVTVPGGMMAAWLGKPLALMNADAALLMSNKVLLPFARKILFGFDADTQTAGSKAHITGNPVRREISQLPPPAERYRTRSGPLNVLIIGGSLGAKILNEVVPAAISRLPADQRPRIVHQSGRAHIAALRDSYAQAGVDAEVVDFIDDMAARYAAADLVICRAGAITVTELCAAGVASVLVPLVVSTTSHQRNNAQWMEKGQAGIHLPQPDLTPDALATLLQSLTRAQCLQMAEAAYAQGRRDANEAIALVLEALGRS